ncbi:MAG: FecR family protein [Candidatus Cloacimonadaceae bacterium]|nr:FecR family protein [Candidatus Cloacimonadaceae bacterium]MDP3115077.1 FecR family protein [Candidatus Cloacimonadaceae bacterium]
MKKIILISLLMFLSLSLLTANAVALFTASKGKVELRRSAKNVKFKTGDMLNNNDEIRTGTESFAAYKFIDATSTIKIFSNSFVKISATKSGDDLNKKTQVNSGSVYARVTSNKGSMIVQTPTTVASVKGTGFMTKFTQDGETYYIVTHGIVDVKVLETGENQSIDAGYTAYIDKDSNMIVRESTEEDLTELERAEIESAQNTEPRKMIIPVADEQGRIKLIEITY